MSVLSKRERLVAMVAGVALGALALDQAVVRPLWGRGASAAARIDAARESLAAADQTFQNDLRARRRWNELGGGSLAADAPAAESQVLNRVREWGQEAGLSLTSLKPERNERERGFQKVTVRATGTGTMRQVSRFLFAVQTAELPLRVSDVSLVSRREGADDLSMQIGLATIYPSPEEKRPAAPAPAEARR